MNEIKEYLAIIVAAVSAIGWLFRLEGRVNSNSKEIMRLERQIHDDRAEARANRAEQNEILREMQRDIKLLLGRGTVQHFADRTIPPR